MTSSPPLTSLCGGAGCGCKLPAGELLQVVGALPSARHRHVLVGSGTADDAGVVLLDERTALVQTVDFFTPPVDDPFDFGRIAAANALSDVYAMGGTPLSALSIVAFPLALLGRDMLGEVLRGGMAIAQQAGAPIVGGHSIDDPQPKYGLAVTGTVDPHRVITNAGGRDGDALVLTKPLGVGAIVAARRHGVRDEALLAAAVATMCQLNAAAAAAAVRAGAHAMTDVTGFGLLGHLHHVARESGLAAELHAEAVPALDGVEQLLDAAAGEPLGSSGGSRRNAAWAAAFARFDDGVRQWRRRLLADATTSGGLLVALPPDRARELPHPVVGRLHAGTPGRVCVR